MGIDPQTEITRDNLSVAESVAAMKDQKIDAFFWIGGLPTGAVTDLVSTPNMEITFLPTDSVVDALREKYGPVYTAYTLPKDVYGLEADVPGLGIGNVLFVNANMPEELAYRLLTTIFDNLDEIKTIHPEAESLSIETAVVDSSIPFHPGAIRFYQEAGVLEYWIVNLVDKTIFIYTLKDGIFIGQQPLIEESKMKSPLFPQLDFTLSELFN